MSDKGVMMSEGKIKGWVNQRSDTQCAIIGFLLFWGSWVLSAFFVSTALELIVAAMFIVVFWTAVLMWVGS